MIEQYITDLTHSNPTVRYEAAQKLGASNDTRAIEPLIAALPDENSKVQYAAFSGLIKLNANGDVRRAAAPLLDMLTSDLNSRVWELLKLNIGLRLRAGLLDMVQTGDQQIAGRIADVLDAQNLDEHQRALLVRMLGRAGDADRFDLLIDLLIHGTAVERGAAGEALGYLGEARAVAPLMLLVHDQSNELREIAAEALGRIGHLDAYDALVALLGDESEWVRRAAVIALGELGDRRAVEPVTTALDDEAALVQDAAFDVLKKLSYSKNDLTQ